MVIFRGNVPARSTLAALVFLFVSAASAAPINTVNNIEWYAEPGVQRNGTPITDSQRTDPLSIFNANDNKWLSLGFTPNSNVGGRVYGNTLAGFYLAGMFEIREVTNGVRSANYPEGVRLTFSDSLNGSADISIKLLQTPASCSAGLTCSVTVLNTNSTQWLVSGLDIYQFTSVEIADITRPLVPGVSSDGFDLGYVAAQTSAVPEPSSVGLVGAGALLIGTRFLRKRSSRASA